MEATKEDVKSLEYREERKKWKNTNDDPEAYALDRRWGLVLDDGVWRLFLILNPKQMKEVANRPAIEDEPPPYLWARNELADIEERRRSAEWDERDIGKRKPGEEGFHGGRPIPMQTFDAEALAKEKKRKDAREAQQSQR